MNCAAVTWALAQKASTSGAKFLLVAIASRTEEGVLRASQAELAAIVQLSDRQVRTQLKQLEADGLIKRERRGGVGAGRLADQIVLVQSQAEETSDSQQPETTSVATGKKHRTNRKQLPQQPEDISAGLAEETSSSAPEQLQPEAPPYDNNSTPQEFYPEPTEVGGAGGEAFALSGEPKSRRKPRRVATERSMPKQPSAKMIEHANDNKFFNGSVVKMFAEWRDFHIAKGTVIADCEASWRTWVAKRVDWREKDAAKAPKGYKFAGMGADGKPRFDKDHRNNGYR